MSQPPPHRPPQHRHPAASTYAIPPNTFYQAVITSISPLTTIQLCSVNLYIFHFHPLPSTSLPTILHLHSATQYSTFCPFHFDQHPTQPPAIFTLQVTTISPYKILHLSTQNQPPFILSASSTYTCHKHSPVRHISTSH